MHARLRLDPRLSRYHAGELDCEEDLLYRRGLHIVLSQKRLQRGWAGIVVPVIAMTFEGYESTVVSVPPHLSSRVRQALRSHPPDRPLGPDDFEALRPIVLRDWPYAYVLNGDALWCTWETFRPRHNGVEQLARDDPSGADLRLQFDGEIFVIRGRFGEIASWAAIKLRSDDVWEIAVVTEPGYRGRGYAKRVVSAATEFILRNGRIPIYIHDRTNIPSARVCRAVGYQKYADIFFGEYR